MNLPASAITFLSAFRGVYAGKESLFAPNTAAKLPTVHVHCFAQTEDEIPPEVDICRRISTELGAEMTPGDATADKQVFSHFVRLVAPRKAMYCATFRLPSEVAFAPRD